MRLLASLPTPFDPRGKLDLGRFRAHVLWLMAKGVEGFLPTGPLGEFLYLTDREREALHRTVLDAAPDRPVYLFTWDPRPATIRYLNDAAAEQGAAGVVLPPPLLYRLDDTAIVHWYRSLHEGASVPLFAYHDPALGTGVPLPLFTELRGDGILAGIFDAAGDPWRLRHLHDLHPGGIFGCADRLLAAPVDLPPLEGIVSEFVNLWPKLCARLAGGEAHLQAALLDRLATLESAAPVLGIKTALRMGFRAPIPAPEAPAPLPPPER